MRGSKNYFESRGIEQYVNYFYKLAVNAECSCTQDPPDAISYHRGNPTMKEFTDLIRRLESDNSIAPHSKERVLGMIRRLEAEPEIEEWKKDDSWNYFKDNKKIIRELFGVYRERIAKVEKEIEREELMTRKDGDGEIGKR